MPHRPHKSIRNFFYLAIVLSTLAACGQTPEQNPTKSVSEINQPESNPGPEPITQFVVPSDVPNVDISKHNVPIEEIYFDTFQPINRAVPLDQADQDLILNLRDAIPPIHFPEYESVEGSSWLNASDIILGYAAGGEAWAYPIRILNFHEIVNDNLDGIPVLISYCPLCYSGIVYDRRIRGQELVFGNTSALYQSDMVMLDYQTGSYWWQVSGMSLVGALTDERLTPLPSITTTWAEWLELYPNTKVLSLDTGFNRNYERDPFVDYRHVVNAGEFAFPVNDEVFDSRLSPGSRVIAFSLGNQVHAYLLETPGRKLYMDNLDDKSVMVWINGESASGAGFFAEVDGRSLTFELRDGLIYDLETGSQWSPTGEAIAGELAGAQLTQLPSKTSFWFALVASEPEIEIISD